MDDRMIPLSVLREYMPKLKDEDLKELGPVEYDQSKVPEVSKKHAENVRRKVYLPDMTESFARGVEYAGLIASEAVNTSNRTNGRQDTIEAQFNAVQQEMTDKDVISAPEIIAARGEEATLKARLDKDHQEVTAQLAQTIDNVDGRGINIKSPPIPMMAAKGDGITDDTLAIQNIINLKKKVFIPEGNFLVSDSLSYFTKQEIEGVGDTSNIVSSIVGKPVLKNAEPFFNTNFHKFRIEGSGNELNGIDMDNGYEHMFISHVSIIGVGGSSLSLKNIYGLHTDGLHLIGLGKTKHGINAIGTNGFVLTGALIKSTTEQAIYGEWLYGFNIYDNIIESNLGSGIVLKGLNSSSIYNNYFENNALDKKTGNDFDIVLAEDSSGRYLNDVFVGMNYYRSQNTSHVVKIEGRVNKVTLQSGYITGFTRDIPYFLEITNTGATGEGILSLEKINRNQVNNVNQYISFSKVPNITIGSVEFKYLDANGQNIDGNIPCTITSRYKETDGIILLTFTISNINLSQVPENRIPILTLPKKQNSISSSFTNIIYSDGVSADFENIFLRITNTLPYAIFNKTGGDSRRLSTTMLQNVKNLQGSITYY